MAVYVDQSIPWPKTDKWPYDTVCHLLADEPEELKSFAMKIGLNPAWIQSGNLLHFDLTPNKRKKAIRMGAIELNGKALLDKFQEMRIKQARKIILQGSSPAHLLRRSQRVLEADKKRKSK